VIKEILENEDILDPNADFVINEDKEVYNYKNIIAEISIEVNNIIDRQSKIDWHNNPDVHKRISREIDDLLYVAKKKYFNNLTYSQIDRIIENIKTVALRRY